MSNEFKSLNIEAVFNRDLPPVLNSKPITSIYIRNFKYIIDCLIPFLNNLTYFSIKV